MTAHVVVIGGGYGGIAVAGALDAHTDVTLVEPRDRFVHNVAALRGLVDPDWTSRLFLPYDRLLRRGRVVRDRADEVGVAPGGTPRVALGSGAVLEADAVVLATGSTYPYPAKFAETDSAAAIARLDRGRADLERARHVLLLGAGPVGLELAGEITARWPDKAVTLIDPQGHILSGSYPDELRAELHRQLDALGVTLLLGTSLTAPPPTPPGRRGTFTAGTASGATLTADLWFRCHGVEPATDYVADELADARNPSGFLSVTDHLNLPGHPDVFAIGDLADVAESKTAKAAGQHAEVVVANILARLTGRGEPLSYRPGPPGIALPLGPAAGASYSPSAGVLGAETTARIKGADMRLETYTAQLGLDPAARR